LFINACALAFGNAIPFTHPRALMC